LPNKIPLSKKNLFLSSLPMMITSIASFITSQTDIFMLWVMKTTGEVGIYQMAVTFSMLVWFWLNMANSIIAPKIAELYRSNKKQKLQNILRIGSGIALIFWIPIFSVFILFPHFFLGIIGTEFLIGTDTLKILAVWQLINVAAWSVWFYMNMTWKQKAMQYIVISWAIINICLNLILIPLYWITWAAIASAISMAFRNITMVIYVFKKDSVKTFFDGNIYSFSQR
jgi:O-antigen/teichoic acid export membrane protein